MNAKVIPFRTSMSTTAGGPPAPPPTIDELTRMSVMDLAAAGFRFASANADFITLEHPTYGELQLANGVNTARR